MPVSISWEGVCELMSSLEVICRLIALTYQKVSSTGGSAHPLLVFWPSVSHPARRATSPWYCVLNSRVEASDGI